MNAIQALCNAQYIHNYLIPVKQTFQWLNKHPCLKTCGAARFYVPYGSSILIHHYRPVLDYLERLNYGDFSKKTPSKLLNENDYSNDLG